MEINGYVNLWILLTGKTFLLMYRFGYLESELTGINEDEIVFFNATGLPSATVYERGISVSNINSNVASINRIGVGLF
jgi:hypothetical protein